MSAAQMLDSHELDAVLVSVSPSKHPDIVVEALSRGLHVWMEKPPALDVAGVERMLAARGDRVAAVGFKKAFMPVTQKAREIVELQRPLQSMLAIYPMSIPGNGNEVLASGGEPNWLLNGVHPLSFLLSVCGPPVAVTAITNASGHGTCVIELEGGTVATLKLASGPLPMESYYLFGDTWHCDITNNNRLALYGDPGPLDEPTFLPRGFDTGTRVWEAQNCLATVENQNLFTQGIHAELMDFFGAVRGGPQAPHGTLEFARDVMRVYEAGLRSQGVRIEL
jgi:predicted dehydrogenase